MGAQGNDRRAKVANDRISQPDGESNTKRQVSADDETPSGKIYDRREPTWGESDEECPGEGKHHSSLYKWYNDGE